MMIEEQQRIFNSKRKKLPCRGGEIDRYYKHEKLSLNL